MSFRRKAPIFTYGRRKPLRYAAIDIVMHSFSRLKRATLFLVASHDKAACRDFDASFHSFQFDGVSFFSSPRCFLYLMIFAVWWRVWYFILRLFLWVELISCFYFPSLLFEYSCIFRIDAERIKVMQPESFHWLLELVIFSFEIFLYRYYDYSELSGCRCRRCCRYIHDIDTPPYNIAKQWCVRDVVSHYFIFGFFFRSFMLRFYRRQEIIIYQDAFYFLKSLTSILYSLPFILDAWRCCYFILTIAGY